MNVSAGGQVYELARLKFSDVRHLGLLGALKVLRDIGAYQAANPDKPLTQEENTALLDAMVEVICTSIRRGGVQINAQKFMDDLDCQEGAKIREAYEAVMTVSGFLSEGEGASPNAESPAT